ncbi:MAG TPA: LuxR C-terminal-related transcriptional regulator [Gemmatimonadota bacterium]|nr:LuxR C-terminal-related transcriptional regulator [Gemmatimonadota bacterium]
MIRQLESHRSRLLLALAFLAMVVGGTVNLVLDAPLSWVSPHAIFEVTTIVFSFGLAVFLLRGWREASRALLRTRRELSRKEAERDAWRRSARTVLEGLSVAIDRQFGRWDLTPAEREVALLLIKGHSHKKIADLTHRSERTARQHAGAVYRKAGLSGRAELAAFFLEDLMLPEESAEPADGPEPMEDEAATGRGEAAEPAAGVAG